MKIIATAALILMTLGMAQAEPRQRQSKERDRHESHNYIIERQQAGLVRGVPTSRLIIGKRDIYPDGSMYEKGNLVGFNKR